MRVKIEDQLKKSVIKSVNKNRKLIPKKTGNLRYHATQVRGKSRDKNLRIVIDQRIAPYATWVDQNAKNGSAGYWERFYKAVAQDLALEYQGKTKRYDAKYK